jgi:hypothetical protein
MIKLVLAMLAICLCGYGQLVTGASKDDWEEINFEFDSAVLTDGFPSLLRLAELLNHNPDYKVKLDGHTDSVGSEKYNEKLSQRRADAVKAFLIKYGARPAQIELIPRGKRHPKVENKSREGRWVNRRVALLVTDKDGKVIGSGGVGDAIKALQACCKDYTQQLADILKKLDKLDEIARKLDDMKGEYAKLKSDVDGLKGQQQTTQAAVTKAPTLDDIDKQIKKSTTEVANDLVKKHVEPRFSILGANVGMDQDRNVTFIGRARYFAPFKEGFAVQAQGEYTYFKERQEGQFDVGLVNRFHRRAQVGAFSSFRHINIADMQAGGTLGQAAFTADYLFGKGKVGFFGTKGFLDNRVINRVATSTTFNVWSETYLKIVDQVGTSGAWTLGRNTMIEGNIGMLAMNSGDNKPGGLVRLTQPLNSKIALTFEGAWNETMVSSTKTYGRFGVGVQFGNFLQPKEYLASANPVPVDVPRVRYETLTRLVRTGNAAPVADAGTDQYIGAGTATLDGSGSFDPDGDAITYKWQQVAGTAVELSSATAVRPTFSAKAGNTYGFRLTVTDVLGLSAIARVNVIVKDSAAVVIQKFSADPSTIAAGGKSTLSWQVQNATSVVISGIGSVNAVAGSAEVSPTKTTTYTLTAKNDTSEVNSTVTVTVNTVGPRILSFTAAPASIRSGEASTLVWNTENADTVNIDKIGNVATTGTSQVSPTDTTTYKLTATNGSGSVSQTVTVSVNKPSAPTIVSFTGSPLEIGEGASSTLSWQVTGATSVDISGVGSQTLQGSTSVTPKTTTTYVLTARNGGGDATASVTIVVVPKVVINSFTATPSTITTSGGKSTLSWSTTGATTVSISGVGTVTPSGSVDVAPTADTTYTITASNSKFSATAAVTVKVSLPAGPNNPPVIKLNVPDEIVTSDSQFWVDASGSTDPDGDTLTYQWSQVPGGSNYLVAAITHETSAGTILQLGGVYGDYYFQVKVTDSRGASATKVIHIRYILMHRG